jgi:hypothetical protein
MPLALILVAALTGPALPAPQSRDLGMGLVYFRVHSIPGDLPADMSVRGRACVLDLRYVAGDGTSGRSLGAWVAAHSGPHTPVLLLANARTSRALLVGLGPPESIPGLVILGPAAPGFQPDVAVSIAPETERRAYAAFENGAPIDSLLSESVDKPRSDEAMLAREHLPDSALADDNGPGPGDLPGRPEPPPQLIDSVLQRAVQLHRALLALKRL